MSALGHKWFVPKVGDRVEFKFYHGGLGYYDGIIRKADRIKVEGKPMAWELDIERNGRRFNNVDKSLIRKPKEE